MTQPKTSLTDPDDFVLYWHDDEAAPESLTDEEALAILAEPTDLDAAMSDAEVQSLLTSFVAAADTQSGAMIALRPSAEDIARLSADINVDEDAADLHLTLLYLGPAAFIDDFKQDGIIGQAAHFSDAKPIHANANGLAVFNPTGDDPCIVLQVGDTTDVVALRDALFTRIRLILGDALPKQYVPFIPHVTLAYTDETAVIAQLTHLTGPITFDAIRIAFGSEIIDIEFENDEESELIAAGFDKNQPRDSEGKWTGGKLRSAHKAGSKVVRNLGGGLGSGEGGVQEVTLGDGTRAVQKSTPDQDTADREVLAADVLNALGMTDFETISAGKNSVVTSFVEGKNGKEAMDENKANGMTPYEAAVDVVTRPGGKEIALLDWLAFNTDRHVENYRVTPEGTVRPIDNGDTLYAKGGTPSSIFVSYWMQPKDGKINPRFTSEELAKVRTRLMALKKTYASSGHEDWHDTMMQRLEQLEVAV